MQVIIDRFEADFTVVELSEGVFLDLPRGLTPEGARVGDVIRIEIDREATEQRKSKVSSLRRRLFRRD